MKKLILLLVDREMALGKWFRAEQIRRLVQAVKNEANAKSREITTVDPIMRTGKKMYPTLTQRELLELSQTVLRIIFTEVTNPSYQTTLLAHI